MKELKCLIDTARELLDPLRKCFEATNKKMAEYEQDIADKKIKKRARSARLRLKDAFKEYNETMDKIR